MIIPISQNIYDVVIVGAGPAGGMAARQLERSGARYLLLDKQRKIGSRWKCAGGLPLEDFRMHFGDERPSCIQYEVRQLKIISKNVQKTIFMDYLKLHRPQFEEWLTQGLNMELACCVDDLKINKNSVEITTDHGTLHSRFVILSHGCNFQLQKKLGLIKKDPEVLVSYGGICRNHGFDPDSFYFFLDDDHLEYMWVFPESKMTANVGASEVYNKNGRQKPMPAILDQRLKKIGSSPAFISKYGGLIPCGGPIARTYCDRVLTCGDAAGFVNAATSEGIRFALQSGRFAAEVILEGLQNDRFEGSFLKKYEDRCKHDFGKHMTAGTMLLDALKITHSIRAKRHLLAYYPKNWTTKLFKKAHIPMSMHLLLGFGRICYPLFRIFNKNKNIDLRLSA